MNRGCTMLRVFLAMWWKGRSTAPHCTGITVFLLISVLALVHPFLWCKQLPVAGLVIVHFAGRSSEDKTKSLQETMALVFDPQTSALQRWLAEQILFSFGANVHQRVRSAEVGHCRIVFWGVRCGRFFQIPFTVFTISAHTHTWHSRLSVALEVHSHGFAHDFFDRRTTS